jgi:hypothetical protein
VISTLSATAPTRSAFPVTPQRIVRDVRKVMLEASSALTTTCRKSGLPEFTAPTSPLLSQTEKLAKVIKFAGLKQK